ncbi:MAG: hypothetical protein IJ535_05105 [Pseudobutyrivibrio sp.]|uniref:hypothetical protein n=1 Tax=Pseudobutyrivibrio sp. TaxID=2014367 RepID=UPI0025CC22F9|nr:hypothetical protein [Pseudobutyrivibrio sp.]MBQ8489145.1 hypothetical protein [Pseudobutyrivibrio sp.]
MERDPFEEYYRQLEPSKREKGNAWNTAIGLQAVDGLKTSDYLKDTILICKKAFMRQQNMLRFFLEIFC